MKIYICANNYNEKQSKDQQFVRDTLTDKGFMCVEDPKACDLIVSLGGDGALLRAAQVALKSDKPLIGINAGRKGLLCALTLAQVGELEGILQECHLEERTLIETEVDGIRHVAVNDILVSKYDFGQTADLSVYVDDRQVMDFRGDGLIIATPTGSTAYNKSAGGPYLEPDTPVLVLTPVCCHDRIAYPYVASDERTIGVKVDHDHCGIYVDGRYVGDVSDSLIVNRSAGKLRLYCR